MSFASLGLSPRVLAGLSRLGYATPTPVQAAVIPDALQGRDVLARAQTGTGKTAAFGLPMIERLAEVIGTSPRPRGLVLVPTRELALQVQEALRGFAQATRLRTMTMVGGEAIMPQVRTLRRGVDIVVATPGRLIDHLDRRTIDLSAIEIVTLDEADRMLDMGFLPPLKRVMAAVPATRQTLLLSATLSGEVAAIAKAFTREPVRIDVAPKEIVAANVVHRVFAVGQEQKRDLLTHVLTDGPSRQALVFCRTKHGSDRVGRHLEGCWPAHRRHPRRQDAGRPQAGPRRLQGRTRQRAGGHRRGGPRPRHREAAAGGQLRPAAGGAGLHPSHRPHRPGGAVG